MIATPAAAVPPTKNTITQHNVLTNPTACGDYGIEWDINLTADIRTFFDDQGRRTKIIAHVEEDNTVTNIVSGLTLHDGPVNFVQTDTFDPETGLRDSGSSWEPPSTSEGTTSAWSTAAPS
jgi:hypothetical protein